MELNVTNDAARWYKKELAMTTPGFIHFFPRYGFGGHIPAFAIGINQEEPENMYSSTKVEDITFYVETKDAWYFDDIEKMTIELNKKLNEPEFIYNE